MADFVTGVGTVLSGVFTSILEAFSGIGNFIFTFGETGTISGLTGAGWLFVLLIGIPLATWLFSKGIGLVSHLLKRG